MNMKLLEIMKKGRKPDQKPFVVTQQPCGVTAKGKTPFSDKIEQSENQVIELCDFLGYGRVMQIASEAWQAKNDQGEGLVIGTHAMFTVPCGCDNAIECEWCCGSGWLTKKVKDLKDKS